MRSPWLVLAFGALLAVLIASSPPQRVGDSREYLAMAMNLARLHPPPIARNDVVSIERDLDSVGFTGLRLTTYSALRDARGRQDFFHFWFYPALAVPGIWVTTLTGIHPNYAFVALNVALLLGAVWVASTRLAWWLVVPLFCSPVLWWTDKSHTEAFNFSLLVMAFLLLRDAPWAAMIALGVAATQNPPIGVLLACVIAATAALRPSGWRSGRFWAGAAAATAVALLHPVYYEWRWHLPTPQLVQGTRVRIPTVQELGVVLWDPNLGLLVHAPLLVLFVVFAAVLVALRARSRLLELEMALAVTAAAIFLWAFAQSTNINNGATAGMSRYAVWLIPLAIPILQRAAPVASAGWRRWLVALALGASAWSIVADQPRQPESYCAATRTATFIWNHWPSLDNPLPEIFAERLSAAEPGRVPVATPGCTKILVADGWWPVPCLAQRTPSMCAMPGALCYANRTRDGYRFVRVPPQAGYAFQRGRTWAWNDASTRGIERILALVGRDDLRLIARSAPGAMLRDAANVAWTYGLESDDKLLVYARQPRPGASLTLRPPGPMAGWLLDPDTGDEIAPVRLDAGPGTSSTVVLPARRAVVLALRRVSMMSDGKRRSGEQPRAVLLDVHQPKTQKAADRDRVIGPRHAPGRGPRLRGHVFDRVGRAAHRSSPVVNDRIRGQSPAFRHLDGVPRIHVHGLDRLASLLLERFDLVDQ